jgi:phosphatidylinositol-3-phosphatase
MALFLLVLAGSLTAPACLASRQAVVSSAGDAPAVPPFSHVLVVIMENREFGEAIGNARMPRFNRWADDYALLTDYYAVSHPSLPNYLALIGGDIFGVRTDCLDCFVKARSLPDLLEAGGRTWKAYLEGLPAAGFLGDRSGAYAKKHNPFAYFEAIRNDPLRLIKSIVPLSELTADLEAGRLPDFSFVVPDMCHSGHDCDARTVDDWLGTVVPPILRSAGFDRTSLLVLIFDEGTTDRGCCGSSSKAGGGHIAVVLISPLVKPGCKDATPYSHYSLLKTIALSWGLDELGHASDPQVNPIVFPWRNQPELRKAPADGSPSGGSR